MENLFFLRIEIIIFLLSLSYMIYFLFYKIKNISFKKERKVIDENWNKMKKKDNTEKVNKISEIIKETKYEVETDINLKNEEKIKISELLRKQAIYTERWEYSIAKSFIVEWLAINKNNRQLNLELANIYNKESEFKKSEFIYRELIEIQKEDFDLLKKLGFVLALQKKYKDSIRVYKEALEKRKNDNWIIDILSDLTFEVEDYEWCIKFAKKTLKDKPRDSEKLQLIAYSYDNLWKLENALNYYKKLLDIQPYNSKILDRVSEIENNLNSYSEVEEKEQKINSKK